MRRKPYPVTELTGGVQVNKDPLLILDKESPSVVNCRFDEGILKKDWALLAFTSAPVLGVPMWFDYYYQADGDTYLLLLTTTSAYVFNETTDEWDDITLGTLVDDCEAAWTASANVTSTADASVYKVGTKSAKHVIAANFTTGLASYKDHATTVDLTTATKMHMWVRSSVTLAAGDIQFLMDDTAACVSPLETIDFPALTADTWTRVTLTIATPASLGAVKSWGLNVAVDKGACTVYLDDIRGVTEYTGSVQNRFSGCNMNDLYIITNGKDAMQKYDGSAIAALGGTPPISKYCYAFYNYLVCVGTTETGTAYPQRCRWSDLGDPETWTGGTSGYVDLVDTADWCVAFKLLGGKSYIFKERTIWELAYVGGTTVFEPRLRIDGIGTWAPDSIGYLSDELIFKGNDNFYRFDGTRVESFSDQIFPLLIKTGDSILNMTYEYTVASVFVEEMNEYWTVLPTVDSTPDTLFKFNFDTKGWVRRNSVEVTAFGYYYAAATKVTWATATGTWAAATGTWRRRDLAPRAPTTLFGMANGLIYEDDRSTTDSTELVYETKDFLFGHRSRITHARVYARYGGFTLYYSTDGGATWSAGQAFAATTDWSEFDLPLNFETVSIRFRISCTAARFEMRWVEPWYIDRARSALLVTS